MADDALKASEVLKVSKLAFQRTQNRGARLGCTWRQATFLYYTFLSKGAFNIRSEAIFSPKDLLTLRLACSYRFSGCTRSPATHSLKRQLTVYIVPPRGKGPRLGLKLKGRRNHHCQMEPGRNKKAVSRRCPSSPPCTQTGYAPAQFAVYFLIDKEITTSNIKGQRQQHTRSQKYSRRWPTFLKYFLDCLWLLQKIRECKKKWSGL